MWRAILVVMKTLIPFLFAAAPVWAQTCPPAPDHRDDLAAIIVQLQDAETEMAARELSNSLWRLWTDAPDARAQALLDEGMARRESYDYLGARAVFDDLVTYCPDYAEGYNQRAFASFLRQEFDLALPDLERTLELNPTHVGALSGKALTLMGLGRDDEAQEVLRAALALNPWLSERSLLREPPGEDI